VNFGAHTSVFPFELQGLRRAVRTLVPIVFLGLVPVALALFFLFVIVPPDSLGLDFRASFWPAADAVLHGHTPYPRLDAAALADRSAFRYPPLVAIVLAPVALLPVGPASAIALVATATALAAALWALGVRDWRCYGISLGSPAVLACLQTAALSAFLALAVALAWRFRDRGLVTPALLASAMVAKLFLWPLLLWLLVVRGWRCAALTGAGAAGLVVAPWVLGFPGARAYPHLLETMTRIEGRHAYTPRALALSLGAAPQLAEVVALALGLSALLAALAVSRLEQSDRRTLALTLLAALLLSPIVWAHYLVVLLPLMAIVSRRLSAIWFAPLGLWFAGGTWDTPAGWQIAIGLSVMTAITLGALTSLRELLLQRTLAREGRLAAAAELAIA
jgi:Glycosyltransferase family 87